MRKPEQDLASPAASIGIYRDGPYLVRGEFVIVGQDGERIDAGRRTVALCRCGKSRIRPFCDGTHRLANFRAAGAAEGASAPVRAPSSQRAPGESAPGRAQDELDRAADCGSEPAEALAWIHLAHEVLSVALERPVGAEEYLAMRLAEPLVRAAWALVETRLLAPPPAASEQLMQGGLPVAHALVAAALDAVADHGEGALWGTVQGLLSDALVELEASELR